MSSVLLIRFESASVPSTITAAGADDDDDEDDDDDDERPSGSSGVVVVVGVAKVDGRGIS